MSEHAVTFHAGEALFEEGAPGGSLFIVEEGTVELTSGPTRERLAVLSPGDLCGEASVLDEARRECSARALSDVKALRLERAALAGLLAADPELGLLLVVRLGGRLHEARSGRLSGAAHAAAEAPTPSKAPRAARLVHESGAEFALPRDERVQVGRAAKGHVPPIDLSAVDGERSLSRRHAALWRQGDAYFVAEEQGVANGTFVNGRRLKPGEPTALADGDSVAFGLVKTVFRLT